MNKCAVSVEKRFVTQIPNYALNNTVQTHLQEPGFFKISLNM